MADGTGDTLGQLDELVGYHLRRASAVLGSVFTRAVEGTALRQVPFAILSVVAANPGIKQGAAGQALGIQRANMVSLINELLEAGHIDRRAAEDDRRAFALTVTGKGKTILQACVECILTQEAELLGDFTEVERKTLLHLLRRIETHESRPLE